MKFYMIHLMPFADLDLSYDKHYNSAWVTLPNSYYDPQKGAKLLGAGANRDSGNAYARNHDLARCSIAEGEQLAQHLARVLAERTLFF